MKRIIYIFLVVLIFWSCEENLLPPANKTIINTGDAINITTNSATLSIFINEVGAAKNIGIIWGENDALDSDNQTFNVSLSNGEQQGYISISSPGTYYYKAYAVDKFGNCVYGEIKSFIIEDEKLTISSNFIQVGAMAGIYSVDISSNTSWIASSDQNWCNISSSIGVNNGSLVISIDENILTSARNAKITVRSEKKTQEITLSQVKMEMDGSLVISSVNIFPKASSEVNAVNISTNQSWTAQSNQSWCTLQNASANGNGTLLISTATNTSPNNRTATITITALTGSKQIAVTQLGTSKTLTVPTFLDDNSDLRRDSYFSIECSSNWTASANQTWCTLDYYSGTGNSYIHYTFDKMTDTERSVVITLTCGSITQRFTIIQRAQQKITSPIVPSIDMILVQGGTFLMGDSFGDGETNEKPIHSVTLNDFYIGKYEITQAQWKAVWGFSYSNFLGDNLPMTNGVHYVIITFIDKLNNLTGKKYRLPTEAEWEYAAKGGRKTKGYKYSGSDFIDDVAWHEGNSFNSVHFVGTKQPNELGIYDMSGNASEFCSDWFENYKNSPQTNPTGATAGDQKVYRGGCARSSSYYSRSSSRRSVIPNGGFSNRDLGFRLVLDVE